MRNHRNSIGMTMINSTKQVNKVKPNVNRATNDSLSSPNQPYNQRYLIIRSALQFYHHPTYTHPNIWSLKSPSYMRRHTFIHDHCWLEYSTICLFCIQPNQYMRISLLRINNKKARSDLPTTTSGLFDIILHDFVARLTVHSTFDIDTYFLNNENCFFLWYETLERKYPKVCFDLSLSCRTYVSFINLYFLILLQLQAYMYSLQLHD